MQKYEILGVIGEGAYGVVLRCRNNQTNQLIAIKKFKQTEEDQLVKKTTLREVKLLRMLSHPNIVELKEAFRRKGIVCLVFEYLQNNLLQLLENSPGGLRPELIRRIVYQMLKGIAYLHSQDIVHRDIKPENLLVSDKLALKICDFGFARQLTRTDEQLTDYVATRWYRSPELLVGAKYGKEVDMWAVGCIFGQLIDGMPMFPGQNEIDQLFLIQKCLGPLTADHYEKFLKNQRFLGIKFPEITVLDTIQKAYMGKLQPKALNLLKSLLKMNPSQRITAAQALQHSYFDGIRQDDIEPQPLKLKQVASAQQQKDSPDKKLSSRDEKYQFQTQYNRLQIRRKEGDSSRDTKTNNPFRHAKSLNKNNPAVVKPKNKTISLEKHHNKDLIMKTQGAFFLQSVESISINEQQIQQQPEAQKHRSNKIYGMKPGALPVKHKSTFTSQNLESTKLPSAGTFSCNTLNFKNA